MWTLPTMLLLLAAQRGSPFVGEWRGRSTCVQRGGPCHDETVVYRVRPDTAQAGGLVLHAWKLVDGVEDDMGELSCTADAAARALTCPMPPRFRPGTWRFVRSGRTLDGTLTMADGTRARVIHVTR